MNAAAHALPSREAPADGPTRADRLSETARRIKRSQAVLGRLANLLIKASATSGGAKDHADGWQFHEGKDFAIPSEADYDPATDVFDPSWLVPEQRRLVAAIEASVARVEFLDRSRRGAPRVVILRVHFA